jgi:16S rRNA (cytosine967-C5)-methyltransferase
MTVTQPDLLDDLPSDGVASRAVALGILSQVLGQKKLLDTVWDRDGAFGRLPPRDRAFVRMLVATALRRKGQLDDLLLRASDKRELPRPDQLRWILYLGITQILFMDVADHAAVNTSVNLAASEGMEGKKGFVNAILRRMTGEGKQWLAQQDQAALNIPAWMYSQWTASYGTSKTKEIALACLNEAALDITIKNPKEESLWAGALEAQVLPTGSLRRKGGGSVIDLPGYRDGAWWIQDASSALPAKLLGDVAGKRVLDLCAAPGGKTAQLAAMGANVVAADRSATRMSTLTENLRRLKLDGNVQTVVEDGSVWTPREKFSHILLDAPCSATGTIRRHPDLLSLKEQKDQDGLMNIQERLLANAAEMLEVGGTMIYCTCSLQKDEGEHQVAAFLAANRNFRRSAITGPEVGNIEGCLTPEGDVRMLPHFAGEQGGMDGFYIARLRKTA